MKKILLVILAMGLLVSVAVADMACQRAIAIEWYDGQLVAGETTADSFSTVAGYTMLVLFERDGDWYIMSIKGTHDFWVGEDSKLYMDGEVVVNDVEVVGWGIYPEQNVEVPEEWDEECGCFEEIPTSVEDLTLLPMTADYLPQSMHIAALSDVYLVGGSPRADVIRLYMGVQYTIANCRVAQSAYDAYTGGLVTVYDPAYGLKDEQNEDCFVLVYFISETPFDEEVRIPVVTDKVIK